jgi:hypothetical protein
MMERENMLNRFNEFLSYAAVASELETLKETEEEPLKLDAE